MKVAFTTDYYGPHQTGGVERVVREVATRLVQRGHEATVYSLADPGERPGRSTVDGVDVVRLRSLDLSGVTGLSLRLGLGRFKRELDDFDVVHAHNLVFTTSLAAAAYAPERTVFTLHLAELSGSLRLRVASLLQRYAARRARMSRAVTGVSKAVAWHALGLGVDAGRLHVVPNAVDAEAFAPGNVARGKRIVYVGRLVVNKGLRTLVRALPLIFAAHPDAAVDVVGDGPMRGELERATAGQRVRFHGVVPDVAPFLRAAAVYVRPSTTDGLPLTVLEAMACGAATVASDVGGTREVLRHGADGLLVPSGDARALGEAVVSVLDSPATMERFGASSRERVLKGYTWDAVTTRYEGVYVE